MKPVMKRVLAFVLTLVLCIGMVPAVATAEEDATTGTVDTGEMTIEGTNSFGNMIAEDLQESEAEAEAAYEAGYSVTALEIENGVATVTYDTLETANLVVAIYSEDGKKLLASGKTEVTEDDTIAVVTIDGEMPTYFYAEAFLLDIYDFSPLCPSYDTPLYTQEMQELLASTTADYDENLVFNLDEDETTNFAVYTENVIRVPFVEGVNTVVSADDDAMVYVIENADEYFTSLVQGDIIAYEYGEEGLLIAKVDTLTVDGTTVTIVGMDAEMEEIFAFVKIEGTSGTSDSTVDMSSAADYVEYQGLVDNGVQTFAKEDSGSATERHQYKIALTAEEAKEKFSASVSLSVFVELSVTSSFKYYVSLDRKFLEMYVTPGITSTVEIGGELQGSIPIGYLGMIPCPGIIIGLEPELVFGISGSLNFTMESSMTFGVKYDGELHNLTTPAETFVYVEAEVEITFGIDWAPYITVIDQRLIKIQLEVFTGVTATVSSEVAEDSGGANAPCIHSCKNCLAIELDFKAEINGNIQFFNSDWDWLNVSVTFGEWTVPIKDMYYSVDHDELDFGECPYKTYRVTIQVEKTDGTTVANTAVKMDSQSVGETNKKGVLVIYAAAGSHTFAATVDGKEFKTFTLIDSAKKVILNDAKTGNGMFGESSSGFYSKYSYTPDSGSCGTKASYHIYDGRLFISGVGKILTTPWSMIRDAITEVHIGYGITEIGQSAFEGCTNLKKVTIPSSVKTIDDNAFFYCLSLESVVIPEGVKTIGRAAFSHCESMTSLVIPSTVTTIEEYAIDYCASLTEVRLPYGLKAIRFATFNECFNLRSVYIPSTVTTIESYAFSECHSLTDIVIPHGVTTIDEATFMRCKSMTTITLPASLDYVNYFAFMECHSLTTIKFTGTPSQWRNIYINDYYNDALYNATVEYVSAEDAMVISESVIGSAGGEYNATFSGVYDTVTDADNTTYHTATFDDLSANKTYTLLVLREYNTDTPLAPTNVLFIAQELADENGHLTFTYLPRVDDGVSYIMACGASEKDLNNATITLPALTAAEDVQAVSPVVYYEGELLVEGVDYVVAGTSDYSKAGSYTYFIRGIYEYSGLVACSYTVEILFGDANANGVVNSVDARKLLMRLAVEEETFDEYELRALDMNDDKVITTMDVRELLLWLLLY